MNKSRTVRIFLSSTFRDFDEERGLLVEQVFPALRERLRGRFVELVDVDLRWGIPAEAAERGQVLSTCLEEIDQCRPYFIGLLGERYGWIPAQEQYPSTVVESHPWLQDYRGVSSVTELEIRYGILDNPAMHHRALFFFRDRAFAQQRGGEYLGGVEDTRRQNLLKQRIEESGRPLWHYATPGQLASLVADEVWKVLDAEFPASDVPDVFTQEALNHEAFAASRRGDRYIVDTVAFEALSGSLLQGHQRILVEGVSGIGKSALLANWAEKRTAALQQDIIFAHFLEASPDATSVTSLVRRLLEFIRREINSPEELPVTREELLNSIPQWLAAADSHAERAGCRWIIILDGLDKLRSGQDLLWLPTFLPSRIHLVVSLLKGKVQDALRRRGIWHSIKLDQLKPDQRRELLRRQLAPFKKSLETHQEELIVAHALSGHPIFLRTLAEELRVFGSFEELHDHLLDCLSSQAVDDLFEKVLHRLERNHGRADVSDLMRGLWVSRDGLTEEEILDYSGLRVQARWAPIRIGLAESITNSLGRLRLSHEFIRKAVHDRYLAGETVVKATRMQLARWFGNRPIGPRRAWEQPFQLWKAGAWTELSDVLSQADMFELVHQYGSNQELHRYWLDLAPVLDTSVVDHYQKILDQWRAEIPSDQGISLSWRLQNFLQFEGETGAFMLQLAEEGWRWCELQYGPVDIRSIRRLGAFASLLSLSKENLQRARTLREDACQKMEAATGPDDPALAAQFLGLAKICLLQGDKGFALSSARRALRISEQSVGLDHPRLVSYLNCLTDILRAIGGRVIHQQSRLLGRKELLEAIQIQTRCLRILAISYGLNHLDSAQTMVTLGKLFTDVDDPVKAERAFRQALKTFSRLLGEQHPRTKTTQILLVKFAERQNPNAGGADRGEG